MKTLGIASTAAVLAVALAGTLAWQVRAGGDLVKFPENYATGELYGGVDRADVKEHRDF